MIDLGTGNNNKINWAMNDKQVSGGYALDLYPICSSVTPLRPSVSISLNLRSDPLSRLCTGRETNPC